MTPFVHHRQGMLHPGTLFILLFFGLAPGVAVLLLVRSVRRGLNEIQSRGRIVVAGGTALVGWAAATYYMFNDSSSLLLW